MSFTQYFGNNMANPTFVGRRIYAITLLQTKYSAIYTAEFQPIIFFVFAPTAEVDCLGMKLPGVVVVD